MKWNKKSASPTLSLFKYCFFFFERAFRVWAKHTERAQSAVWRCTGLVSPTHKYLLDTLRRRRDGNLCLCSSLFPRAHTGMQQRTSVIPRVAFCVCFLLRRCLGCMQLNIHTHKHHTERTKKNWFLGIHFFTNTSSTDDDNNFGNAIKPTYVYVVCWAGTANM